MAALIAKAQGVAGLRVENMSWSPIHIVQQFQGGDAVRPDRLVLVGAAAVSREPGRVRAFRWSGGTLAANLLQARVYEAVTGIVDIENTLAIGEHFGVWPAECYSVEADIPADAFGRMVIAESQGASDEVVESELGFSPTMTLMGIVETAMRLAVLGADARVELQSKSARELATIAPFTHNFTFSPQASNGVGGKS
jgi:hypothetical protein